MIWTNHALRRCQQRGVDPKSIFLAMDWGKAYRQRGGKVVYHVGKKSVKKAEEKGVDIQELEGLAVVLAHGIYVLSVIKVSHLGKIKKKLK